MKVVASEINYSRFLEQTYQRMKRFARQEEVSPKVIVPVEGLDSWRSYELVYPGGLIIESNNCLWLVGHGKPNGTLVGRIREQIIAIELDPNVGGLFKQVTSQEIQAVFKWYRSQNKRSLRVDYTSDGLSANGELFRGQTSSELEQRILGFIGHPKDNSDIAKKEVGTEERLAETAQT